MKIAAIKVNGTSIDDNYFTSPKAQKFSTFSFAFNQIDDETNCNLTVFSKINDNDVVNAINNIGNINLKMNRNFTDGLETLESLIIKSIKDNLINNQAILDYFLDNNFVINNINNNGTIITNQYFKQEQVKTILQCNYSFGTITNQNFYFNLTVNFGDVIDQDIINIINNNLKDINSQVNAHATSGGLAEAKNNIKDAIWKKLDQIDKKFAHYFKQQKFVVLAIKDGSQVLDDNYFQVEKPATKLTYTYTINSSNENTSTTNLAVLKKKSDQDVIDALKKIWSFSFSLPLVNDDSGFEKFQKRYKEYLSQLLFFFAPNDETVKAAFDAGNFQIQEILVNGKTIDANFFKSSHLEVKATVKFTFGSVATPITKEANFFIKESEKKISDAIKTVFPEEIEIPNKTEFNTVVDLIIRKITIGITNNTKISKIVKKSFDNSKKIFKINQFSWESENGKYVDITKFINNNFYYNQTFKVIADCQYGSFEFNQTINVVVNAW